MQDHDTAGAPTTRTRRGHGEGSYWKEPNGSWRAAFTVHNADGTTKRQSVRGKTYAEVVERSAAAQWVIAEEAARAADASGPGYRPFKPTEIGQPAWARVARLEARMAELERELNSHLAACGRIPIKQSQRNRIFFRDHGTCRYCGTEIFGAQAQIDHLIPIIAGGTNADENLVTACRPCNLRKRDFSLAQVGMTLLPVPAEDYGLPAETVAAPLRRARKRAGSPS